MIKKVVCCLLSMSLLCVSFGILTACNSAKYEIGIFVYKYDDNYITTVRNALDKKLKAQAEDQKINYTFYNGEGNQATQTAQIDSAITAGVDLLVINAVDQSAAGDNLAEKCKAAGKPAIFFNREVPDSAVNKSDRICFVGTDPNAPGYMLGEMIADLLGTPDRFSKYDLNQDGKIQYAMLRGDIGNPEAATVSGVSVFKTVVFVFMIAGMLYGVSAFIESARIGSNSTLTGVNYELDAIAACVIGGVSFMGGIGKIRGVIMGVVLLQLVNVGLVFLKFDAAAQTIVKGAIILIACAIDMRKYLVRK